MEARNECPAAAAAESVAMSGISTSVLAKRGVTVEIAAIRGVCRRAGARTQGSLSTTAAPPSEVAHTCSRRNGSATIADSSTSSRVKRLR